MNVKSAVLERYSEGAYARQESLCCPVDYDMSLLKLLPQEIIDKDYGCGDPSRYVQEGDIVLDLGSGSGKICYMVAQLVGDKGRVIGVDMNDDMLQLAGKYQVQMAEKLGSDRVAFHKAHIQDLALDLTAMDTWLENNPVTNVEGAHQLELWQTAQRKSTPLIADNSVDLVISNCVLNLVGDQQKRQLVDEIFRVLKSGGRIAISDIVSDAPIPEHLKADDDLWSGCISGAFLEEEMFNAFHDAGFLSISLDKWDAKPWQVVEGIEFRSVTVTAVKGSSVACLDCGQAVIYKGPFQRICDDEGHEFPRGVRMAVCERTFKYLTEGPHKDDFIGITPAEKQEAVAWCAPMGTKRPASETKGGVYKQTSKKSACC